MMDERTISIVGGGAWGTALSIHLARKGRGVKLWLRESELVVRMRERHDNPVYLPGITIPEAVLPFERIGATLEGADLVIVAVPSQFARAVYREMAADLASTATVVVACKGIEQDTLALPLDVAAGELGEPQRIAVLSGPTFAEEVASDHPTAVVGASDNETMAGEVQRLLSSSTLRLYTNTDPVGVQIAGALKNVIAIATGIGDSLGMGTNARAAIITRGLAEISRLGIRVGGQASTFSGLAGLGDLVLTCTGRLSRNHTVGQRIGHGERLQDILDSSRSVAEGVPTTRSARRLGRQVGIDMPLVEEVHRILFEDGPPLEAMERLMTRPLTSENERSA
jgi:glycerol-3-phosphate dehydrogenase (NAD(P)+)